MKPRLLIVEDSELNRELLVQLFEDAYELEVAADGATAVALAATNPPDGVLMDIGLPGLSGLEVARSLRASGVDIPLIAVSSRVMPGDREHAIEAGFDEFVPKPIDDVALVELVRRIVDKR